ncbi:protein MTO1 homolog, mitochondrial [Octopus vulgaris]|uniref:Protein MTO1 homolog, mitochondrial n=1 Tax=Octopus vulgaris TaxID=6645 RepID=A0AA36FMK6_OCTVU|nr:protein MTO1 homolog, mitochondrial [Octopus vulgaris]
MRFGPKSHPVWLEPEGLDSTIIYPSGISCTMPEIFQLELARTIPGLENCEIVQADDRMMALSKEERIPDRMMNLSKEERIEARSGRRWAQCPRLRDNSERYGDQSLALGAVGLNVRGYETTVSATATRARSGRRWAQCPRLRDNSERYGDQSSLWAPLGSMSAATRQQ